MSKDTYWFKHDSNARNDVKVVRLTRELGIEGYGIYFMLIEVLREQLEYKLPFDSIPDIAYQFHTSDEKIKAVVMRYELFEIDENRFFSPRLKRQMEGYDTKKQKLIDAGRKGYQAKLEANTSHTQATLEPPLSLAQAIRIDKNRIDKNKEEGNSGAATPPKPRFVKPEKTEITNYMVQYGNIDEFTAMGQTDLFYDHYESNGWKIGGKSAMVDWKASARNWIRNTGKFDNSTPAGTPVKKMVF